MKTTREIQLEELLDALMQKVVDVVNNDTRVEHIFISDEWKNAQITLGNAQQEWPVVIESKPPQRAGVTIDVCPPELGSSTHVTVEHYEPNSTQFHFSEIDLDVEETQKMADIFTAAVEHHKNNRLITDTSDNVNDKDKDAFIAEISSVHNVTIVCPKCFGKHVATALSGPNTWKCYDCQHEWPQLPATNIPMCPKCGDQDTTSQEQPNIWKCFNCGHTW